MRSSQKSKERHPEASHGTVRNAPLTTYDELGNQILSGQDVNTNGTLDLAGPDRVNASDTSYQLDASANWWQVRASILYAGDSSATPTTNSIQRTCLTGLGSSSALGLLTSELVSQDIRGNQTVSRTYVDRNAKTVTQTVTYPDSASTALVVTVNGRVQSQTSKTGHTTTFTYDALGRQTGATDPRTGANTTHYADNGSVDYVADAAGHTNTFGYDAATGRKISQTDPLGYTVYTAYDIQGHAITNWGATYPVAYIYDATYARMTGMRTWRTATGAGDLTTWLYDLATGLLTNKLYADGKGPAYTYTPEGKLARRTWARTSGGQPLTTEYSYDPSGNLTNIHYSATNTPDVSFTYDRLGRQKTASDGNGTRSFAYNQYLQLTNELQVTAGVAITSAYDTLGRPAGFNLNSGYQNAYGYDTLGRFSMASNFVLSAISAVNYSYLANSDLISQQSVLSGLQVNKTYEDHRNLLTQVNNAVGSATISQYDYFNDAAGRRTSVKNSGSAFETGSAFNKYTYNSKSEVVRGDRYWGTDLENTSDPVDGQTFAYGYDNIGNRTNSSRENAEMIYTPNNLNQYTQRTIPDEIAILGSAQTGTTVTVNNLPTTPHGKYWYIDLTVTNASSAVWQEINVVGVYNPPGTNDPDIVTSVTGHVFVAETPEAFTYDDDGNQLTDARLNYSWDCENRLIGNETRTNLPGAIPSLRLAYTYDYMSRRVSKTVFTNSSFIVQTSSFIYDGWNLIEETINGGPGSVPAVTNRYAWGLDLSGTLQGAGGIGGLLSVTRHSTQGTFTYYPCYDANGNITDYVDTNGVVVAHREYDPYGNTTVSTGPMKDDFSFWFSTKYLDKETGLYYYGYRYYSPEIGRWPARDPLGEEGGLLLYGCCNNDGVNVLDAFGTSFDVTYDWNIFRWIGDAEGVDPSLPTLAVELQPVKPKEVGGCCVNFMALPLDVNYKVMVHVGSIGGSNHEARHVKDLESYVYSPSWYYALARFQGKYFSTKEEFECWKGAWDLFSKRSWKNWVYWTTVNVDLEQILVRVGLGRMRYEEIRDQASRDYYILDGLFKNQEAECAKLGCKQKRTE